MVYHLAKKISRILFSFIFLTGCFSEKKLAQLCLEKFPNDTTEIIVIDTLMQYDSIKIISNDTIVMPNDTMYIDTSKIIRKTIYKTIKPTIELTMLNSKRLLDSVDMALKINDQKISLDEKDQQIVLLKQRLKDANKYKFILYSILGIAFIFGCVSIRKWFNP